MTAPVLLMPPDRSVDRLAFAVRLTDACVPEREVTEGAVVRIVPEGRRGVRNAGGWHLFLNLPVGSYRVAAEAAFYLSEQRDVDTSLLDPGEPVMEFLLKPESAYPFPSGATLIRGMVRDTAGNVPAGVTVAATPWFPAPSVKGRVRQGGAQAGQAKIRLENLAGSLKVGDLLLIRDADRAHVEFVRIVAPLPASASQSFNLESPLRFAHAGGTPIYLMAAAAAVETLTNGRGEFVVYFRTPAAANFVTRLAVSCPGYRTTGQELEIVEGATTGAGVISLPKL